jgi:hypothetical protein
MKFSQFKNVVKIEEELNECAEYLANKYWAETQNSRYLFFPRLNIFFRSCASLDLFWSLSKEYRYNISKITKTLAYMYTLVVAIILWLGLGKLFFPSFLLNTSIFYPAIIGGNNRLRFINSSNSYALVIAKNSTSTFFTKNAMRAYQKYYLYNHQLIPSIFKLSERVYLEEQITGVAVNRFHPILHQLDLINIEMNNFFSSQVDQSKLITLKTLIRYKACILRNFFYNKKSEQMRIFIKMYASISDVLIDKFGYTPIPVCLSHGDLNRGNVLISANKVCIIDWEYFMYFYSKYDSTLFNFNLRHCNTSDYIDCISNLEYSNINILVFLIEDLFFRILNFKTDVDGSHDHIDIIVRLMETRLFINTSNSFE